MKNLVKTLGIIIASLMLMNCEKKPVPPVISTTAATDISTVSAVSGGIITNDGGAPIISKGICWNTANDPTIANDKTNESGESTSFISDITQLIPGTLYYVRAYATNSAGTGYGKSESFKTLGDKPLLNSQAASNIQLSSATLNGNVNPGSLSTVVTFEYGISINYGSAITAVQSPLTGNLPLNVSADLTDLAPGTTYHFRIKAENSLGITYGNDLIFTTLGQVPAVTQLPVSNLHIYSATLNGIVNANYLTTAVAFEWGTTTGYGSSSIALQSPVAGNSDMSISLNLTGLTPGTTYHARIKAENVLGITYSSDLTFTTYGPVPAVTEPSVSNLQLSSATLNGKVNANNLSTTVSFEYGPTTGYGSTSVALQSPITGSSPANISLDLSGLAPETTYHFRISATNELGTTKSSDMTFTTYSAVDGDNNLYHSVTIGTQTWLTENLKTTRYSDGTAIPFLPDNAAWAATVTGAYCDYNNTPANSTIYGRLYNWYAADNNAATKISSNGGKNVCPTGWHVANHDEWNTLITFLGGETVAGGKLKETGTIHWLSPNTGSTNETGFTALPGGVRNFKGTYSFIYYYGFWWRSLDNSATSAWYSAMNYDDTGGYSYFSGNKQNGLSVRCIRD